MKRKIELICRAIEVLFAWGMTAFLGFVTRLSWWELAIVIVAIATIVGAAYLRGLVHADKDIK